MTIVPLITRRDASEPGSASVFVRVTIGAAAYELLLDTGAATSALPEDATTRAFPTHVARSPARGALGPGRASRPVVVPTLEVGPVVGSDLLVDVVEPRGDEPVGILGLDVLAAHRLDVFDHASRCTFDAAEPIDRVRPLTLSSHRHPHVPVSFATASTLAIWDTGASVSVVDDAFAAAHPDLFEPLRESVGVDAYGNRTPTRMVTMAECEIGGRMFPATLAALAPIRGIQPAGDPEFNLILGYPIIAAADWAIDFPRRVWGFRTGSV